MTKLNHGSLGYTILLGYCKTLPILDLGTYQTRNSLLFSLGPASSILSLLYRYLHNVCQAIIKLFSSKKEIPNILTNVQQNHITSKSFNYAVILCKKIIVVNEIIPSN